MYVLINISKDVYTKISNSNPSYADDFPIYYAIKNGKPLPKGHKRLIEDNFKVGPVFDEEGHRIGYQYVTQEDLNNAKTIIEADKESE